MEKIHKERNLPVVNLELAMVVRHLYTNAAFTLPCDRCGNILKDQFREHDSTTMHKTLTAKIKEINDEGLSF